MKKLLLCLWGAGIILGISAQELQNQKVSTPKHEIYAGLGLLNSNQMIAILADAITTIITLGYLVEPGSYRALTPFVGYRYNFSKRFSLGCAFAYDFNSVKVYNSDTPYQKQDVNRYYMTFAVEPKINYMYRSAFQLYGCMGLGATIVAFENARFNDGTEAIIDRMAYFNAHVSPIGMRIGKTVGGFVEFGYGYKGIVNTGVNLRF